MVYGVWCMVYVYGEWCIVYGKAMLIIRVWRRHISNFDSFPSALMLLFEVYGVWCMVYAVWCMVYGV